MKTTVSSKSRLRAQTVRTFLSMFLPLCIVIIASGLGLILLQSNNAKTQLRSVEQQFIQGRKLIISHHINKVIEDILYVSDAKRLLNIREREVLPSDVPRLRNIYRSFLERRRVYDYIQWLGPDGMEKVRVNYDKDGASIVENEGLKYSGGNYYFSETSLLKPGEIYISKFDLEMEGGKINEPYCASVRVSRPYLKDDEDVFGIVILSYRGQDILTGLEDSASEHPLGIPMLCNSDGYWIYHPEEEMRWGFMFEGKKQVSFKTRYPDVWKRIAEHEEGVIDSREGIFVFNTIRPLHSNGIIPESLRDHEITVVHGRGESGNYHWKLISLIPHDVFMERVRLFAVVISAAAVIVLSAFGFAVFSIAKNRAKRTISEEEYKQELRKLKIAVEQSANVIVITDTDGNIILSNEAFDTSTGYTRDEVLGKNPRILKSGQQADEVYKELWDTISRGKVWKGEFLNRKKDGTLYWEEAVITPIIGETGMIEYYLAVKEDITRRKQAEEALTKAKEEAEAASRLKSEFLANMSHEIRTPMNALLGFTDLLLEEETDSKKKENLLVIRDSGKTLLDLLNDLLDFSTIEAGKLAIENNPFEVKNITDKTRGKFSMIAARKGIDFSVTHQEPIPAFLIGDEERINRIVFNLLSNAFKFTQKGSIALTLSYSREQGRLIITVTDTGIGIDENKVKSIFSAFEQAESAKDRHYGGTGLGLAISKRLAELMGGSLIVKSVVKKGSVFTLTLPLQEAVADESLPTAVEREDACSQMVEAWIDGMGGDGDLEAILYEAMEDLPRKISSLRRAIETGDRKELKFLVHDLKGSTGNLGMNEIYIHAHELNQAVENDVYDGQTVWELFERLSRTVSKIPGNYFQPQSRKREKVSVPWGPSDFNVLIAEDNVVEQKLIERLLKSFEVDVDIVENGEKVLDALKKKEYDILFLDMQMPVMSGEETIRTIRADDRLSDIHVVALTSGGAERGESYFLDLGCDDFILKPINKRLLEEKIIGLRSSKIDENGSRPLLSDNEKSRLSGIIEGLQQNVSIFNPSKVAVLADELKSITSGPALRKYAGRLKAAADTFDDQAVRTILEELRQMQKYPPL